MFEYSKHDILRFLTIVFIILFNTYYQPIDGRGGMGPVRYAMMGLAVAMLPFCFKISKAVIFGFIYLATQYLAAIFHPESIRWSTLLYSAELILMYISLYHLIYVEKVFTIDQFIKIVRWLMIIYFGVFITQQFFMLIGIRVFPLINMTYDVHRGFGCYSLSMEPSTFARTMLVCYYAYIKCHEYKRGCGPFSLRELFSKEYRFITIIFLWMMCTMGSGTAFVCLIGLAAYFVRWHNWYYIVPILLLMYFVILLLQWAFGQLRTSERRAMTVLETILGVIEAGDPNLEGHSLHVRNLTLLLYDNLPLTQRLKINVRNLEYASLLLDVGKLGVPRSIINKSGKLEPEEWDLIRRHPELAVKLLQPITAFDTISNWIKYHHERVDGTGYYHLRNDQIPLASRLIAVADTYSAMTMERSYRATMTHDEAVAELKRAAGSQLDSEIVRIFVHIPYKKIEESLNEVRTVMRRYEDGDFRVRTGEAN